MGDFFGFTFNGYHTSDLGIVRVSNGDRYKEDLLPDLDNATVDVPGGDGTYYFGSYYKSKKFDINIAFDSLTEEQLRNLGRVFSTRKPSLLVFDERPYKGYYVKVDGSPNIEAVCFDEGNSVWQSHDTTSEFTPGKYLPGSKDHRTGGVENIRRVYKGEGEINFVAYDPFGYIIHKDLDSYRKYEYTARQVADNPHELGLYVSDGQGGFNITDDIIPQNNVDYYKKIDDTYEYYTVNIENPQSLGLYELDNEEYVATTDSTPVSGKTYYLQKDISNTDEWKDAAKLKTAADLEDYDVAKTIEVEDEGQTVDNEIINVYNPGDMPAPFQIYIPFIGNTIPAFQMILEEKIEVEGEEDNYEVIDNATLKFNEIKKITTDAAGEPINNNDQDTGILINTKNHLVEGVRSPDPGVYITTGTLYNNCVAGGLFFKINEGTLFEGFDGRIRFSKEITEAPEIIYDYIYF